MIDPLKRTSNGFSLNGPLVGGLMNQPKAPAPVTPAGIALSNISGSNTVKPLVNLGATPNWKPAPSVAPTTSSAPITSLFGGSPGMTNPSYATGGSTTAQTKGLLGGADAQTQSRQEIKPDGTQIKETYFPQSAGTYKGQEMKGTDAEIAARMKQIDTTKPTQETTPTPPTPAPTPTPPDTRTQFAKTTEQLGQAATDTSAIERANRELEQLRSGYATAVGNIESTPIPLQFQQGRAQVLGRQYAAQESAAAQRLANELAARGQTLGALGSVAGLVAPRQQGTYVLRDPVTGQPIGGTGGMTGAISQGAQLGAYETGVGQGALDKQAISGAENQIASITDLIKRGNLNPSTVNIANEAIQGIQKNLSSADYQTLLNSLEAINAALTQVTGTPVDIATLSSSQGTSLLATINNQVQMAKARAEAKAQLPETLGGQTTGKGLYDF